MLSAIKRAKERLQFTGWLQYLPTGTTALLLFVVAEIFRASGFSVAADVSLALGFVVLAVLVFDIVTVRLEVQPFDLKPRPRDHLDAFDVMRARVACRAFQSRELTPEHRAALMESTRRHTDPATGGLFGRGAIRFEYIEAPLTVWPVVGAKEFFVAVAPKEYSRAAIIDVGRDLQKVVIDATRRGIATCWIGPGADHRSVQQHLGDRFDPERDHIICVCALGYRSLYKPVFLRLIQKIQRNRLPLDQLFFADPLLTKPIDVTRPPYDRFGRCYEVCQWSPSSFNGQPTRAVVVTEPVVLANGEAGQRVARIDFCASTKSRYYAPVALGIWCANWELGCQALGIPGHFEILSDADRAITGTPPELPRYDVSWIADDACLQSERAAHAKELVPAMRPL